MALRRWSPMEEFARLWDEMTESMGTRLLPSLMMGERLPAVDGYFQGKDLVIKADLPGFAPEEVDVRVYPDSVVIKAEARSETEADRDGYFFRERRRSSFQRELALPVQVIPEDAQATFRNGVLELRIPCARAGGSQGHRVEIKS